MLRSLAIAALGLALAGTGCSVGSEDDEQVVPADAEGTDAALEDGDALLLPEVLEDVASPRDTAIAADTNRDAARPSICDGVMTAPFQPPTTCDGPGGTTTTKIPPNNIYATSWFGCYRTPDGTIYKDPTDNCLFACGPKGLCPSTMSGPECEATLKWFAANSDRYGCGARIRMTNCANGKAVVVATLDRGPNCVTVEKAYGVPVLDMSHPAMAYLFDGAIYGASDKKRVVVEKVDPLTPLGPVK